MMRLFVLGSGSRGNCFAVETDGAAILPMLPQIGGKSE